MRAFGTLSRITRWKAEYDECMEDECGQHLAHAFWFPRALLDRRRSIG